MWKILKCIWNEICYYFTCIIDIWISLLIKKNAHFKCQWPLGQSDWGLDLVVHDFPLIFSLSNSIRKILNLNRNIFLKFSFSTDFLRHVRLFMLCRNFFQVGLGLTVCALPIVHSGPELGLFWVTLDSLIDMRYICFFCSGC